jgi:hypothetical protein
LAARFPAVRDRLQTDSYFTINAFLRLRKEGPKGEAYGYPLNKTTNLRYLCACYADIDFDRLKNLTFRRTLKEVFAYLRAKTIPPLSALVNSGRGLWLLWYIRDEENPSMAQSVSPEKIESYGRVQRAIIDALADVGVDPVKDPTRYMRVPGSLNATCERSVRWLVFRNPEGAIIAYKLKELEAFFGVTEPKRAVPVILTRDKTPSPGRLRDLDALQKGPLRDIEAMRDKTANPNMRHGWDALHLRRMRDFDLLRFLRGGFSRGCRNHAALIYAWLLRYTGAAKDQAAREVARLGAECRPTLSRSECDAAIRSAYNTKRWKMTERIFVDWLRITPEESAMLQSQRVIRSVAPPINKVDARHDAIREIIAKMRHTPSCREMAEALTAKGFSVGKSQVAKDFKTIGVPSTKLEAR